MSKSPTPLTDEVCEKWEHDDVCLRYEAMKDHACDMERSMHKAEDAFAKIIGHTGGSVGAAADALAKKLAEKVMNYIGTQLCLNNDIVRSDIELLFGNDILVFAKTNLGNQTSAGNEVEP